MAKAPKFGKSPSRAGLAGKRTGGEHIAPQTQGQYKFPNMPPNRGQGTVPGVGKGKGAGMPARGLKKSPVAF